MIWSITSPALNEASSAGPPVLPKQLLLLYFQKSIFCWRSAEISLISIPKSTFWGVISTEEHKRFHLPFFNCTSMVFLFTISPNLMFAESPGFKDRMVF